MEGNLKGRGTFRWSPGERWKRRNFKLYPTYSTGENIVTVKENKSGHSD